jgi:release factor glutamine methyltransferase
VVDLGAGSGAIAVTIAIECPQTTVCGIDVSAAALRIAAENAQRLGARVAWRQMDGRRWLTEACLQQVSRRPSVLVSNPPYIPSADVERLDPEVRQHEPRLALDGGPDGLTWYRSIRDAGAGLFADGPAALFLEVGHDQADAVLQLFREAAHRWPDWRFEALPDLRGIMRVVWGQRLPA